MADTNERYYPQQLYTEYFRIHTNDYRKKLRFYEDNLNSIGVLSDNLQLELKHDYLLTLFEVGKYQRYIDNVDELIERSIIENIVEYKGKDLFQQLLFKKAACHYNLSQIEEATHISSELIKLDPTNALYKTVFKKCKRIDNSQIQTIIRGVALLFLFASLGIIMVELLVVRPWYPEFTSIIENIRNAGIATSFITLIVGEAIFMRQYQRDISSTLSSRRERDRD